MGVKLEKTSCFWRAKGSGRWENRGCHKMQPFLPEKKEVKSAARRASAIYNWQVKLSHLILLCLCLVLSVYCKFKGTLQHRHHGRVWPGQQPFCWEGKTSCHQGWNTRCVSLLQPAAEHEDAVSLELLLALPLFIYFLRSRDCDQRWGVRWPQALISAGQCSGRFGCSERFTEIAISLMLFWDQFHLLQTAVTAFLTSRRNFYLCFCY